MFKKFIYMTALSLALASSPDASAAGKCIVSGCSSYNSSSIICNNISKCINVGSLNFIKNYSITEYNPTLNKFLFTMSILESIFGSSYFAFRDTILEKCDSNKFVKYIKHRSNNETRDKITGCVLEKYLLNKWILLGACLLTTLSLMCDYYCTGILLIPSTLFGDLRLIADLCYACSYIWPHICCCECMSDFSYAEHLYNQRRIQGICERNITSEREYLFKHLIKRNYNYIVDLVKRTNIEKVVAVVGSPNITREHIIALHTYGKMSAEELYSSGKGISIDQLCNANIDCGAIENKNNKNIYINNNNIENLDLKHNNICKINPNYNSATEVINVKNFSYAENINSFKYNLDNKDNNKNDNDVQIIICDNILKK